MSGPGARWSVTRNTNRHEQLPLAMFVTKTLKHRLLIASIGRHGRTGCLRNGRCPVFKAHSSAVACSPRELSKRPDDRPTVLSLNALFKSNWDLDLRVVGEGREERCRAREETLLDGGRGDESHERRGLTTREVDGVNIGGKQRRKGNWGEQALFWLEQAVRNRLQVQAPTRVLPFMVV